jgi:hypothetical protein
MQASSLTFSNSASRSLLSVRVVGGGMTDSWRLELSFGVAPVSLVGSMSSCRYGIQYRISRTESPCTEFSYAVVLLPAEVILILLVSALL